MKIAVVHDVIYPYVKGGAEKRVWEISRRLADRGHEVHIFGMKHWKGEDVMVREGVYLHGVCNPADLYIDGKRSIKTAIYFSWKLLWSLKGDFDVIDSQQFPYLPCFSAKFFSSLRHTPLVITWHEVWDDYWREYLGWKGIFGKGIERLTTRLPDKIIPVSERVREDLLSAGVKGEKMKVVPNGVDTSAFQKSSRDEKIYDVLYVGRLVEHKRVDLLLRAMSLVKEESPSIKGTILGEGPERDRLIQLARSLGLEESVDFMGFSDGQEGVVEAMRTSKLFVLPSEREGFGIVLLEANACGLPVVTVRSKMNAASDLVKDGLNGLVCSPTSKDMAEAIFQLLKDDSYETLSESSRRAAERYDWSLIADKIERIYEEVTLQRGSGAVASVRNT